MVGSAAFCVSFFVLFFCARRDGWVQHDDVRRFYTKSYAFSTVCRLTVNPAIHQNIYIKNSVRFIKSFELFRCVTRISEPEKIA
jgi:hypothetical protein